jgi:hypothetical protein
VLMLSGLFGEADRLARLADEWDRELRAHVPLPIGYFKCDEARDLDGEFKYWRKDGRDEKVRRLASLVDRDDLLMVFSGVDLAAHSIMESHIGEIVDATKHPFNHPYLLALMTVMMTVGRTMWQRGSRDRIEVIFDEHSVFRRDAKAQWEIMREVAPDWLKPFLPVEPWFRDDKDYVVLQAGDLLAGNARMVVEKDSKWPAIRFDNLRGSGQYHWAGTIGGMTIQVLSQRLGIPPELMSVKIMRPEDGGV